MSAAGGALGGAPGGAAARRKIEVSVTWTPGARTAMESLHPEDASRARRGWAAALRRAARECVANVPPEGAATRWAQRHEDLSWSLDATFVCDEEMREMNARFRARDRPTDVLSFSQAEQAESAPGEDLGDETEVVWPGAEESAALGDIVIAVETAHRQARERAHADEVEVLFLAIHGALHLLGYDHGTSSQRRAMWRVQDDLFERLKERLKSATREKREKRGATQAAQVLEGNG